MEPPHLFNTAPPESEVDFPLSAHRAGHTHFFYDMLYKRGTRFRHLKVLQTWVHPHSEGVPSSSDVTPPRQITQTQAYLKMKGRSHGRCSSLHDIFYNVHDRRRTRTSSILYESIFRSIRETDKQRKVPAKNANDPIRVQIK